MRIKSLQIAGFKSFADKTTFAFSPGLTAIVGPNGCGKSNVVDAMRWAMGEQSPRRLRGKGMDDVIFVGSEGREGIGMAEVTLTFDNREGLAPAAYAGFTEIQVTRRLFRTGESEYEINKGAARMRDVLDFFRDTGIGTRGYTIVEQGQIAAIVSAKAEERRQLIEEAAGISKYKARRREAERKLDGTQQNLVRVSDVLGEIRRQISSLERQARKAARYKRFKDRMRWLDLSISAEERRSFAEVIGRSEHQLESQRARSAQAEAQLTEREVRIEQMRLDLVDRERAVVTQSEALFALRGEIKTLESRIEFERREREQLGKSRESQQGELESLRIQRESAAEEQRTADDELSRIDAELGQEEESLAALEAEVTRGREQLAALEAERDERNARLVEALTDIARAEDRLAAFDEQRSGVATRLRRSDEVLEVGQSEATRVGDEQRHLEEGLRNLLVNRDELMQKLREAMSRSETLEGGERSAAEALRAARERRDLRRARLASLQEVIEGAEDLSAGARYLIEQGDDARRVYGIRGLVRDVLEVDADAERAVEAVLRERAQGLAVSSLESGLSALESLREAKRGGAVLIADGPDAPATQGFVPLGEALLDRVRAKPGFEGVARSLLAGVNLVPDLSEALKIYGGTRFPATFVTPEGDVLTPEGVLRGAGSSASGVLARVREVRELESEVSALEANCAQLGGAHEMAQAAVTRAVDELDNLRNRHHTAALAVASHEKDLELSRERVKALGEAQEGRSAERSELMSEGERMEREIVELRTRIETQSALRDGLQREVSERVARIGQQGREQQRLEARFTERRVSRGSRVERREQLLQARDRAGTLRDEAGSFIERREREIREMGERSDALAKNLEQSDATLRAKLAEEQQAKAGADRSRDHYESLATEIRSHDDVLRELRGESSAQRERAQGLELELSEARMRLAQLDERVRDRWQIELSAWTPPVLEVSAPSPETASGPIAAAIDTAASAEGEEGDDEDEGSGSFDAKDAELLAAPIVERKSTLDEVRRKLEAIGEVNLSAIEEHEELGERFRFLSDQKEDLDQTVASLREAIARINRTSRRRFRETFDAVNERFQKNFPRLFEGGRAALSLAESEDVLEAGIEIMAQPPGKRLQNVTLLSGGEKTLTACALLVSLFQVHPSPFFLLDEVDAALDDANVGRLNEIVREMASDSQFLLITHNKATIEVADQLYGVTMEEKGVSKVVSVELHDAAISA